MSYQLSKRILLGMFVVSLMMTMSIHAVESYKVSNYGGGIQIWFEVEHFDERNPDDDSRFALSDEPGAYGRSINSLDVGGDASGYVRYTFNIGAAGGSGGTWYFWGRVINPSNQSDFMLVDGHPGDQTPVTTLPVSGLVNGQRVFEENAGSAGNWAWSGDNHNEGHTKELQDGENTMWILNRQAGAIWDVMMWTNDIDYVPTDADYENATAPSLGAATGPSPADGATDVPRDVVLGWTPGAYAPAINGHKILMGEVFSDVNEGTVGVTQNASSYAPPQRLDFDTTYYWRVDEVNAPPDSTVHRGAVWSFTTEPVGYPIANITTTASSSIAGEGPENTVNGSGLSDDLHSTETGTMWLSAPLGPQPTWIQFDFDKIYILHEAWVWNSNTDLEDSIGFGARDVTIEYSVDGNNYTPLGTTHEFSQAPGDPSYAHNTTIDFGGLLAKHVRFTVNTNWGGWLPQFGLAEVRFLAIPTSAREPSPDSGAADVDVDVTLAWREGRQAATHNVYFSTDEQAVIDGTEAVSTVTEASYSPASLDLASTYYWRVDEVNDVETPTTWQGDAWSFSTQEFLVVDDFESYNDIEAGQEGSNLIYMTWIDGFDNPAANGSTIGYTEAFQPTMESGIVHGGSQSVPLIYDNSVASLSEVTVDPANLAIGPDWSRSGVITLGLWFYGTSGNTGQLYVKVNGVKIPYDGDAGNLAVAAWQPWNIDLTALGVNLQAVTSLVIGIEGSGATGILYLDDIRLYAYTRQLVTPVVPDPAGLVVHYELEGNANDSTGTAHGTVSGGTFVAGKSGQAISLAGIGLVGNDYVDCGNPPQLNFGTGSWTVSAWITMPDPTTENSNIFANGGDNTGGIRYMLGVSETTDHKACLTLDDNVTKVQSTSSVSVDDGQWHHIVGIRDGSNIRIYVDGFQNGDDVALPDGYDLSGTSQANAYIGAGWNLPDSQLDKFFIGVIDDVRVYNYALSSAEVRSLAGATLPYDEPF